MTRDAEERLRGLRHDLASPLSAILAETQLLLLRADEFDGETVSSLRQIESLARQMGRLLHDT